MSIDPADIPGVREREILRVAGDLGGADAASAVNAAQHEVLKWAATQIGAELPIGVAQDGFEFFRGGRTCIATGLVDEKRTLWALRVDRPDAHTAARTWTTEVTAVRPERLSLTAADEHFRPVEPTQRIRVVTDCSAKGNAVPSASTLCYERCGAAEAKKRISIQIGRFTAAMGKKHAASPEIRRRV